MVILMIKICFYIQFCGQQQTKKLPLPFSVGSNPFGLFPRITRILRMLIICSYVIMSETFLCLNTPPFFLKYTLII